MELSDKKSISISPAADTSRLQTAGSLRQTGRFPPVPFNVQLADGRIVTVVRLLRVLPGKRIVGEGWLNSVRVLVKLFIARGGARHWRREYSGITALEVADLPTPELKASCALTGGGYTLLTTFFEPSETLAAAWKSASHPPGDARTLALLTPALNLLGRLHASGLIQGDPHLGNFLRYSGRLFIIDGDAVEPISPGKPLAGRKAIRNIAALLSLLSSGWDTHHEHLLAAYNQGNPSFHPDPVRLQQAITRTRAWRVSYFLAKSVRDCTLFAIQSRFVRFTAVVRDQANPLAPLLAEPDRAVKESVWLKDGDTSTVAQVEQLGRTLVIKRYNLKNWRHAFSRLWRPSRAWHSWKAGLCLQFIGLPTPAPLAMIEERIGPLRRRAWLITEFCHGKTLLDHLDADREPPPAEAAAITSFFNTLYRERISHGDFKATNLLWHEGRLVVIDLDAVRQHRFAVTHAYAWQKDRARLLRNWPSGSILHHWLDARLPR